MFLSSLIVRSKAMLLSVPMTHSNRLFLSLFMVRSIGLFLSAIMARSKYFLLSLMMTHSLIMILFPSLTHHWFTLSFMLLSAIIARCVYGLFGTSIICAWPNCAMANGFGGFSPLSSSYQTSKRWERKIFTVHRNALALICCAGSLPME